MQRKDKYHSVQVYINKDLHQKLKDKLEGIPISVWFRHKIEELLKNDQPISL
jgi:hypothetical protein